NMTYVGNSTTNALLGVQGDGGDQTVALQPLTGSVTVWCTGENVLGCQRAVSDTVYIAIDPVLAHFSSDPVVAFIEEPISLIASGIGVPFYWDLGPGSTPAQANTDSVSVVFSLPSIHQPIVLSVTNA